MKLSEFVELFHSLSVAEPRRIDVLDELIDVSIDARKEQRTNDKHDNGKDALCKRVKNERTLRIVH